MIGIFAAIGIATCGGLLMVGLMWGAQEIDHWRFMRRLEKAKKACPNCGGTGRVQS